MNELGKNLFLAVCAVRGIASERAELEWDEWEGDFMTQEQWQQTAESFLADQPAQQEPVALPEKIYEFVPTPEPVKWHHPECEGQCIACLIEQVVQEAYGSQGLGYLQRHLTSPPASKPKAGIRVWGWVWKNKIHEDGCSYIPSYTPEQPFKRGELLALVDPADLHQSLENTKWHHPTDAAHGIKGDA